MGCKGMVVLPDEQLVTAALKVALQVRVAVLAMVAQLVMAVIKPEQPVHQVTKPATKLALLVKVVQRVLAATVLALGVVDRLWRLRLRLS